MCASNSLDNIFFERWLEPGMHVSSIKQPEIEVAALLARRPRRAAFARCKPDPRHHARSRLGRKGEGARLGGAAKLDFNKLPTLPDLIIGKVEGRQSPREITCFMNNIGMGYQFAAAGSVVYRKARDSGLGHDLPTDWFTEDVHP